MDRRHHHRNEAFGVANWTVPEASGNYCGRGAGRFGTHSTHENFTPIYYNRVMFVAHFNAGVRRSISGIRSTRRRSGITSRPRPARRRAPGGGGRALRQRIQTNNVEVDDRGYIYAADRAGAGLHILELTGAARRSRIFKSAGARGANR